MKKILISMFVLIFSWCFVGCVDTSNGPHIIVSYDEGLISSYPYQVTQEYASKNENSVLVI